MIKRKFFVGVTFGGEWVITRNINQSYMNYFGPMTKEAAEFMCLNVGNPHCRSELDAEILVSALEEC